VKAFCPILIGLLLVCPSHAQKDIQRLTIALSATASDAALPISVWYNIEGPPQASNPPGTVVVGTGFLINTSGDFITAGHVIDSLNSYKENPKINGANLTARIRNRAGGGSDIHFTITDRDYDHDLVLCHQRRAKRQGIWPLNRPARSRVWQSPKLNQRPDNLCS
jgi:hypothetical protein